MTHHIALLNRHGEDTLHHCREARELQRHNLQIATSLLLILHSREVTQGIVGSIGNRDWGLEFVGYVVREVTTHLLQTLLAEHSTNKVDKHARQQNHNHQRREYQAPHLHPEIGVRHRHIQSQGEHLAIVNIDLYTLHIPQRCLIASVHHHLAIKHIAHHLNGIGLQGIQFQHTRLKPKDKIIQINLHHIGRLKSRDGIHTE